MSSGGPSSVRPAAHQRLVLVVRNDPVHRFGGVVGALHDPGMRLDFVHRVRRVVDGGAVFFLGGAQRMLARFDIELRNHQPPLVDRGHHRLAHPLHPRAFDHGAHPFENQLLERDMQDVELRRPHPRQHPFLAMPAQIDVGGEVVAVAQVLDEPDERVGAVLRVYAGTSVGRVRPASRELCRSIPRRSARSGDRLYRRPCGASAGFPIRGGSRRRRAPRGLVRSSGAGRESTQVLQASPGSVRRRRRATPLRHSER